MTNYKLFASIAILAVLTGATLQDDVTDGYAAVRTNFRKTLCFLTHTTTDCSEITPVLATLTAAATKLQTAAKSITEANVEKTCETAATQLVTALKNADLKLNVFKNNDWTTANKYNRAVNALTRAENAIFSGCRTKNVNNWEAQLAKKNAAAAKKDAAKTDKKAADATKPATQAPVFTADQKTQLKKCTQTLLAGIQGGNAFHSTCAFTAAQKTALGTYTKGLLGALSGDCAVADNIKWPKVGQTAVCKKARDALKTTIGTLATKQNAIVANDHGATCNAFRAALNAVNQGLNGVDSACKPDSLQKPQTQSQ